MKRRHAQLDVWRGSLWVGFDPTIIALALFAGWFPPDREAKISASLGPFYVGAGVWL